MKKKGSTFFGGANGMFEIPDEVNQKLNDKDIKEVKESIKNNSKVDTLNGVRISSPEGTNIGILTNVKIAKRRKNPDDIFILPDWDGNSSLGMPR